jgi:hypothetical protein
MIERTGDLWDVDVPGWRPGKDAVPWIVVPTNGEVKANGDAVMGAGVARQAADRFPGLARELGRKLKESGNYVQHLGMHCLPNPNEGGAQSLAPLLRIVVSFPTKHRWREMAREDLIERSAMDLANLVEAEGAIAPEVVLLPRVGTGLGGLGWNVVKRILERHLLGTRYVVVTP